MEQYTINRVRVSLGCALNEFEKMKCEYKRARLDVPFDKYTFGIMERDIEDKSKVIAQLRQELETYQLEFLFGS